MSSPSRLWLLLLISYLSLVVLDVFSNRLFGLGKDYTLDFFGVNIPYAMILMPTKTFMIGGWIRVKKKPNGDQIVEVNLDPSENIDFRETLRKVRRKDHHHKHES